MTNPYTTSRRRRPFIPRARETRRLLSMLGVLILVGMMIAHTSRPQTWAWLAENQAQGGPNGDIPPSGANPEIPQVKEVVIPNPTDEDPAELAAVQDLFRNVRDKIPMEIEEMASYWRLFKWSRAQTMASMEARSQKSPFFTQFWERSDKSRGKLVTLRLHIRRVLSHEAPENSAGVKRVYEFWGVTDESRGHPYVVITSELPPTMHEGANVMAEAVFCGYFLKVLGYEASDAKRGAPLFVGKIRALPNAPSLLKDPKESREEFWQGLLSGGIVLLLLAGAGFYFRPRKSATRARLEAAIDADAEVWLANPVDAPVKTRKQAPNPFVLEPESEIPQGAITPSQEPTEPHAG